MKPSEEYPFQNEPKREDLACWMDILRNAFEGLYPTDQRLEELLDHFESTP